jgi:hypothetical protein
MKPRRRGNLSFGGNQRSTVNPLPLGFILSWYRITERRSLYPMYPASGFSIARDFKFFSRKLQLFFDVTAKNAFASCSTSLLPQFGHVTCFSCSVRVRTFSNSLWQSWQM